MPIIRFSIVVLLLTAMFGCRSRSNPAPAAPTLADQLQQLRVGATDEIDLKTATIDSATAKELSTAPNLRRVWIEHAKIKPSDLQTILANEKLQQLKLGGLNDTHAHELTAGESLTVVNLPHSTITNAGLAKLQSLPELELLRFQSGAVTDEGVRVLADFPSLRWAHFIDTPITDASLDTFIACEKLESLYLDGTNVTDEGLSRFAKARRDVHIHFNDGHIADDPQAGEHEH